MTENNKEFVYAGFWIRLGAFIIDTVLVLGIIMPILFSLKGIDNYSYSDGWIAGSMIFFISYVFSAFAVILFWIYYQATPGKMAIGAKIVDAKTGNKPSTTLCIERYLILYLPLIISIFIDGVLSLFLFVIFLVGILSIAFDKKKQGWHDKLTRTVVIKKKYVKDVKFKNE